MTRLISNPDTGWRHRFAFFAECVIVGLAITATGIFVVTLPAAIAAGALYLRTWGAGEKATLGYFGSTFLLELRRLWAVSLLWVVATTVLFGEFTLVTTLDIPLATPVGGVLVLLGVGVQLIMLRLATFSDHGASVPQRLRTAGLATIRRPRGTMMLLVALALVVVVVWQLLPLLVPALGLLALGVASVRAMDESQHSVGETHESLEELETR